MTRTKFEKHFDDLSGLPGEIYRDHFKDWQPPAEKVKVPQFVDKFINKWKYEEINIYEVFNLGLSNYDDFEREVVEYFREFPECFAQAWVNGYEVEQEKLLTTPGSFEQKSEIQQDAETELDLDDFLSDFNLFEILPEGKMKLLSNQDLGDLELELSTQIEESLEGFEDELARGKFDDAQYWLNDLKNEVDNMKKIQLIKEGNN